jgi:hypothetical protein
LLSWWPPPFLFPCWTRSYSALCNQTSTRTVVGNIASEYIRYTNSSY